MNFLIYLIVVVRNLVTEHKIESCAVIFIMLLVGFGHIFHALNLSFGFAFFASFFGTVFLIKSLQYD